MISPFCKQVNHNLLDVEPVHLEYYGKNKTSIDNNYFRILTAGLDLA